jgi:4-hydroxybenzoate polyprenyltransferase
MKEGTLKEYAKLFRLPSSLGISVVGVIGALTVKGVNLEFLPLIILLLMGVIGNVLGYVLNDYMDVNIDKRSKELSERPLVKESVSRRAAFVIIISCLVILFLIPIIFFRHILLIFILLISVVLGIFYNTFCKKIVGSELFLAGAMASFCLFGAVAVSEDIQGLHELGSITWVVVILMFLYVFIMDMFEGNFKDVENDRKAGAITLPIYLGVRTTKKMHVPISFKILNIFIKSLLIIIIFIPFIFLEFTFWVWQIFILIGLAVGMVGSMLKMLNERSFDKKRLARYARRHGMLSYFVFPFILMRFIGIQWTMFLILYPAIWPLLLNYILYENSFTPAAYIK